MAALGHRCQLCDPLNQKFNSALTRLILQCAKPAAARNQIEKRTFAVQPGISAKANLRPRGWELGNANKADSPNAPFGHVAYLIACHCGKIVT